MRKVSFWVLLCFVVFISLYYFGCTQWPKSEECHCYYKECVQEEKGLSKLDAGITETLREKTTEQEVAPEKTVKKIGFQAHSKKIVAVFYSQADQVLTVSQDRTLRLWQVMADRIIRLVKQYGPGGSWINGLPDQCEEDAVCEVKMKGAFCYEQKCLRPDMGKGHVSPIRQAVFDPQTKQIITAGAESHLLFWELSGPLTPKFSQEKAGLNVTALRLEGNNILLGEQNGSLAVMNLATRQFTVELNQAHQGSVLSVASPTDSAVFLSAGIDGFIKQYALADLSRLKQQKVDLQITLMDNPYMMVVVQEGYRFAFYDPYTLITKPEKFFKFDSGFYGDISTPLAFYQRGARFNREHCLMAFGTQKGYVLVFYLSVDNLREEKILSFGTGKITSTTLAFSPDGDKLAIGTDDGQLLVLYLSGI